MYLEKYENIMYYIAKSLSPELVCVKYSLYLYLNRKDCLWYRVSISSFFVLKLESLNLDSDNLPIKMCLPSFAG